EEQHDEGVGDDEETISTSSSLNDSGCDISFSSHMSPTSKWINLIYPSDAFSHSYSRMFPSTSIQEIYLPDPVPPRGSGVSGLWNGLMTRLGTLSASISGAYVRDVRVWD